MVWHDFLALLIDHIGLYYLLSQHMFVFGPYHLLLTLLWLLPSLIVQPVHVHHHLLFFSFQMMFLQQLFDHGLARHKL